MLPTQSGFDLNPTTYQEAMDICKMLAESELVPKTYQGKPNSIYLAIAYGRTFGLNPFSSLRGICVVNGICTIWGDTLMALVKNLIENFEEKFDMENYTAYCTIKRKGDNYSVTKSFSWAEAETAGLSSKAVWKQYPKVMMETKARARCLRLVFADILNGIPIKEDLEATLGIAPQNVNEVSEIKPIEQKEQIKIENKTEKDSVLEKINEMKKKFNKEEVTVNK